MGGAECGAGSHGAGARCDSKCGEWVLLVRECMAAAEGGLSSAVNRYGLCSGWIEEMRQRCRRVERLVLDSRQEGRFFRRSFFLASRFCMSLTTSLVPLRDSLVVHENETILPSQRQAISLFPTKELHVLSALGAEAFQHQGSKYEDAVHQRRMKRALGLGSCDEELCTLVYDSGPSTDNLLYGESLSSPASTSICLSDTYKTRGTHSSHSTCSIASNPDKAVSLNRVTITEKPTKITFALEQTKRSEIAFLLEWRLGWREVKVGDCPSAKSRPEIWRHCFCMRWTWELITWSAHSLLFSRIQECV